MNGLPRHWGIEPFHQVARYAAGRTPARANGAYWKGDDLNMPWVAISDMEPYGRIKTTTESITRHAYEDVFRGRAVPAGTLLMSFKLTIGRISTLVVPACHNEAIIAIYPRKGIDQRFLGYFLSQVDYTDHHDRQIKGNTLNKSKIDQIQIAIPPEQEQKAIADALDLCRMTLETERRLEDTAIELKNAAMRELFTRGLRGEVQKESEIGPIPQSWEATPLGRLGKIGNGSTPKKTTPGYWKDGNFPWLTSAKVYDREIFSADQHVTDLALKECHLPRVQPGAVLMAITGQGKTLGHCAILRTEATISQHVAYIQADTQKADPGYIRGYLESQYDSLRQVASGGGSTKGALTCAFLKSLKIPLPSLEEQRHIVEILDAIDRKIDLHKRKRAVLEELFRALLHKLMTGEIDVNDLDLSAIPATNA